MSALRPEAIARSRFGGWLGTELLNRLVAANGTKVVGQFETSAPYRFEVERMYAVTGATGTLNGRDLGTAVKLAEPVEFGDLKNVALYIRGKSYLPILGAGTETVTDRT